MGADGRSDRADRIAAALVGVAVGDSLGATCEFMAEDRQRRTVDVVGGGAFGWAPGAPTDDTDLTVALLRGVLDAGPDRDVDGLLTAAIPHFLAWYDGGPRDIGGTTAGALQRLRAGVSPRDSGATADHSAANGSLMRTMPVAVANLLDVDSLRAEAAAASAITHAEPRCVEACLAYCMVVRSLVVEQLGPADAIAAAAPAVTEGRTRSVLEDALADRTRPQPFQSGGYVLHALDVALWAVLQDRPAEEVLIEVASIGGDADTNAAIAGGLLGARDGAGAWPDRWTSVVTAVPELREAAAVLASWQTPSA